MSRCPASCPRLSSLLRVISAAALLVFLLPAHPSPAPSWSRAARADAGAEDPATRRAREHYERGEQLFALGRFREAMAAYEAAYEARPLPGLLFNIGQCHRNLGDYASAVFSFRQYLQRMPDAPNRDAVLALIEALEVELRAADRGPRPGLLDGQRGAAGDPAPGHGRWLLWTGVITLAVTATVATVWLMNDDKGIPGSDLGNLDFEHDRKALSPYRSGGVGFGVGHGLRW